jgi:hypothetical protein
MTYLWAALALLHITASAYINYARGGSRDWLEKPSWLPARQLTAATYFLPVLWLVLTNADGPWYAVTADVLVLYALPAALFIAPQGMGHGSYMDVGHWDRPDNETLRHVLRPLTWLGVSDRAAGYDLTGLLVKGALMGLTPGVVWYLFDLRVLAAAVLLGSMTMPIWYGINNRWTKLHERRFFGARVYWAELMHGAAIGASVWVGVLYTA